MSIKSLVTFRGLTILIAAMVFAQSVRSEVMKIDLTSALRLADEQNTELAIQLERVKQAELDQNMAWYQWLPTVRAGYSSSNQDGALQNTTGSVFDIERKANARGFGLPTTGAGLAPQPGLSLEIDVAEGIFRPLASKQKLAAARAQQVQTRLGTTLQVASAYYDLVQAKRMVQIAEEAAENAKGLARTTNDFAEAGEGLQADAERAAVESLIQLNNLETAKLGAMSASVRLGQLLRLEEGIELEPVDSTIVPMSLFPADPQLDSLLNKALTNRPELLRYSALVEYEETQLNQRTWGLLFPKLGASFSDVSYKGRPSGTSASWQNRQESTVAIYWELENLGLTSWAKKESQQSRLREAQARQEQAEADIVADVSLALGEYRTAGKQAEFLKAAVDRARRAYELSNERIYEGQGLPLEVLQAMKALEEVEMLYLMVSAKRNLSQLYLLAATGDELEL